MDKTQEPRLFTRSRLNAVLIFLVVAFAGPLTANADSGTYSSAYAAFWYVDENTEAEMHLKNASLHFVRISPKLFTSNGEVIQIPDVTLGPLSSARVGLRQYLASAMQLAKRSGADRWGDGSRPKSVVGGARIIALSNSKSSRGLVAAWILSNNKVEGLSALSMFHEEDIFAPPPELQGQWWAPYEDTEAYVALQNRQSETVPVNIRFVSSGETIASHEIVLRPEGFALVRLKDIIAGPLPEVGGVEIRTDSSGHYVEARGLLVSESRGFSTHTAYKSYHSDNNPARLNEIHSPVGLFGRQLSWGESFQRTELFGSYLLLRNISAASLDISVSLYGSSNAMTLGQVDLPAIALKAGDSMALDLNNHRGDLKDGFIGTTVRYHGKPRTVVTELFSVSSDGDLSWYDSLIDTFMYSETSTFLGVSYDLTEGRESLLVLRNVSKETQSAHIFLDHDGKGSPLVISRNVAAGQLEVVDIRKAFAIKGFKKVGPWSYGGVRIATVPGAFIVSNPTIAPVQFDGKSSWIISSCPKPGGEECFSTGDPQPAGAMLDRIGPLCFGGTVPRKVNIVCKCKTVKVLPCIRPTNEEWWVETFFKTPNDRIEDPRFLAEMCWRKRDNQPLCNCDDPSNFSGRVQ